jgi:hypothetical protein
MAYEIRGSTPHDGSLLIPILSRIHQILLIHNYLFKIHSNIVLPTIPSAFQQFLL